MTDPVIVGVDPGKKCAAVGLLNGMPVFARKLNGTSEQEVIAVIDAVKEIAGDRPMMFVIERQFMMRGPKANFATTEKVVAARNIWEVLLRLRGIPLETVYPSVWQRQMSQVSRFAKDGRELGTKQRYTILARLLWGKDVIKTQDLAAAALIARGYYLSRI